MGNSKLLHFKNIPAKNDNSSSLYLVMVKMFYYPPWGPGGLIRECVLRIPMRVVKGD